MPHGTFRPPSGTTGMALGVIGMPSGTIGTASGTPGMASGAFRPPLDHSDPRPNVPTRVGMKFLILLIVAVSVLTLRVQRTLRVEVQYLIIKIQKPCIYKIYSYFIFPRPNVPTCVTY